MEITFEELRRIKHSLPQGSVARIARHLKIEEQTVRNYFGAHQYKNGELVEWHLEPGPNGGIVHIEDVTILMLAIQILKESGEKPKKINLSRHLEQLMLEDDELLKKLA